MLIARQVNDELEVMRQEVVVAYCEIPLIISVCVTERRFVRAVYLDNNEMSLDEGTCDDYFWLNCSEKESKLGTCRMLTFRHRASSI